MRLTRSSSFLRRGSLIERDCVNGAARSGTAHIEFRARLDTSQTELLLVPTDGSEPLWLTRTTRSVDL